jgi:hypothetical protein
MSRFPSFLQDLWAMHVFRATVWQSSKCLKTTALVLPFWWSHWKNISTTLVLILDIEYKASFPEW